MTALRANFPRLTKPGKRMGRFKRTGVFQPFTGQFFDYPETTMKKKKPRGKKC